MRLFVETRLESGFACVNCRRVGGARRRFDDGVKCGWFCDDCEGLAFALAESAGCELMFPADVRREEWTNHYNDLRRCGLRHRYAAKGADEAVYG